MTTDEYLVLFKRVEDAANSELHRLRTLSEFRCAALPPVAAASVGLKRGGHSWPLRESRQPEDNT